MHVSWSKGTNKERQKACQAVSLKSQGEGTTDPQGDGALEAGLHNRIYSCGKMNPLPKL